MKMSRVESAMRAALAFNETFNRHDVAAMMALLSENCLFENYGPAPDGAVYSGKPAITEFWLAFFRDSPHARREIEDLFGFGRRCVKRWRYDWVDDAGEKRHVRGLDIFQEQDGLITELLSYVKA